MGLAERTGRAFVVLVLGVVACAPARSATPPAPPVRAGAHPVTSAQTLTSTLPEAAAPVLPAEPVRVRLPALNVDAAVVPVGVSGGEMEVPLDVATIGWYRFGPRPGSEAGSAVLTGHVDDRVQGRGTFHDLARLAVGDVVAVVLADGTQRNYRVRIVESIAKSDLPVDRLFDREGPARLTLVTCGGSFDYATRSYRDNIVVTSDPT